MNRGPTESCVLEGEGKRLLKAKPLETSAGSESTAGRHNEALGTWEIPGGLGGKPSMVSRMAMHLRRPEAAGEVGPADSTLSAGKLRTWGSGGAEIIRIWGHMSRTQRREEACQHN